MFMEIIKCIVYYIQRFILTQTEGIYYLMSKKYKVLFIGKGGSKAGLGHLVRIEALMRGFVHRFDVSVLANLDDIGRYFLLRQGINYFSFRDFRGMLTFLERKPQFDIIFVDMYPPPKSHLFAIKNHCDLLLCFDDMGHVMDETFHCVWIRPQETFNHRIYSIGKTTVVMGSNYFPLRPDLLIARKDKQMTGQVKNMAIILGGAPQEKNIYELTRVLDGFLDQHINLHVVGGFDEKQTEWASFSPRIFPVRNVNHMGDFINRMDIGIIGGGFIKFEFMCVGSPFAMISLCSHQEKLGRRFSSQGYGDYLGKLTYCLKNPQTFKQKILSLISDENRRSEISTRSRRLVDGQGSQRILQLADDLIKGKKIA